MYIAGKILVIVEYCRYGNLRTYLIKHKNNFRPVLDYVNADAVINAAKLEQICVNLGGMFFLDIDLKS